MKYEIIRDPLWNNIRVDELAVSLIDTDAFQRLRYVRQLGPTYLVYPGATHTRFEHALGAYHLANRTLAMLDGADKEECDIISAAALLHDIGHYPFSHALEEIGALHHEDVARPIITEGVIADILRKHISKDAPERICSIIRGESQSPLQGLISGSLDLDKIEYLKRDALMCGVPYGEIDVDRLTNSLVIADDPETGRATIAVLEKGLSALESLLFAKYQMYRNVYWHHAVRSATAMYKRAVEDALIEGKLDATALATYTDEGLLLQLAGSPILAALKTRRLYKRAAEWSAEELSQDFEWVATDRERVIASEKELSKLLGVPAILDFPAKTQMLGLDIPVARRNGEVHRLTAERLVGGINLPALSEAFYRSARWLRVFTAERVTADRSQVMGILDQKS